MGARRTPRHVPEKFLRQLWKNRHFEQSDLKTTDGRPIEIISPGTLNRDGGPDFIAARLRIAGITYRGAVELHQGPRDWIEHHHHLDPKYNPVILHVVLHAGTGAFPPLTKSRRALPVLLLDRYLTSSYIKTWKTMILDERSERLASIKCFSLNAQVEPALIMRWLKKLAIERIELKVRRFEERLKELIDEERLVVNESPPSYNEIPFGINPEDLPPPAQEYSRKDFSKLHIWEQLLYEGIMEALGYSKNQRPFLTVAQSARLRLLGQFLKGKTGEEQSILLEAILFSIAGLLPSGAIAGRSSAKRVKQLRKLWRPFHRCYRNTMLTGAEWQFFRLRPENFPTLRIAGAARLIVKMIETGFFKSMIQTMKLPEMGRGKKFRSLEQLLCIPADRFWSSHYRFGEKAKSRIKTLIGRKRADEIILNVLIPVCLLYARVFRDKEVRREALNLFEQCPAFSANTVTNTIERQLVRRKFIPDSAMLQQGELQLYKFYCIEERCAECAVGKIVWGRGSCTT